MQKKLRKKSKELENSLKKHMSKPHAWHISGTIKINKKYIKVKVLEKIFITKKKGMLSLIKVKKMKLSTY
jgi:hypothetical protein